MTRFNCYSDEELDAEFDRLFPCGFAGDDVLEELAPDGWEKSPLLAVFHPSLEQVYQESIRVHHNINALRAKDDQSPLPPEPTFDEISKEFRQRPIEIRRELGELIGQCLWDVYSDNHEVVSEDDRVLDLGSFRASGGYLAERLNRESENDRYDYMDFYMGTIWVADRADLTPVYQLIFRRLQRRRLDWIYHFPRLHLVDLRPLKEALDKKDEPEWLNYSPAEAFAQEEEGKQRDQELAELRESLDEAHRKSIEEALERPPPITVRAYQSVYGGFPRGWPPMV